MKYTKISHESVILLQSRSQEGSTPAKAINEAIKLINEHGLNCVYLNYDGFSMLIEPNTDFRQILSEFYHWETLQTV